MFLSACLVISLTSHTQPPPSFAERGNCKINYSLQQTSIGPISVYVWQVSFDAQLQIQSVTWRFQKQKWIFNWHLHFLLKYHLNVTSLVVRVISISNVSIDVWGLLLHKSHYMPNSKLCMSIDVLLFVFVCCVCVQVFACQMSETYKFCVKSTHWGQFSYPLDDHASKQ